MAEQTPQDVIELGRSILNSEIQALHQVTENLNGRFYQAVQAVLGCRQNVVLSGVGKSYFIAQKISASMASTGTPSIALHPVDALHGDLGRVRSGDVVITLSNSGASNEIVEFAQATSDLGVTRICITCRPESNLARQSDIVLDLGDLQEACPMGVAPSTTTTAMLAVGDAITLTVAKLKDFTLEAFARNHPGGALGRQFGQVASRMRPLNRTATVSPNDSVLEAVTAITEKRSGTAIVVEDSGHLMGILTDGDLRRMMAKSPGFLIDTVASHMQRDPKTVQEDCSVEIAIDLLTSNRINALPVLNEASKVVGYVDIQDVA